MIGILSFIASAAGLVFLKYLYHFVRNYVTASRTGIPFIVVPVDQNNTLWMILSTVLRPWMSKNLPSAFYSRIKYAIYGWEFHEKLQPFHRVTTGLKSVSSGYEKSFILSSCGRFEFWTSDTAVVQQILLQPKDFQQSDLSELFVGQFGTNVLCADGDAWTRHRRVVAGAVTERISPIVWVESVQQTRNFIQALFQDSLSDHRDTKRFFDMLKTVTIQVLSKAGMGVEKNWTPELVASTVSSQTDTKNSEVSYMDAVKILNDNMAGPIIIPNSILLNWPAFIPGRDTLRQLGLAKTIFPVRTLEMLTEEKRRVKADKSTTGSAKVNLLSMMVALSNDDAEKNKSGLARKPALTDDELISNLYVFTAAGYDTTANTTAYAVTLLMRYPKWQQWLLEEVDYLLGQSKTEDDEDMLLDYPRLFPKCTRILAFMFETLRLFPPLIHLAKMTKTSQKLTTANGHDFVLPGTTNIFINIVNLHLDASLWRGLNPTSEECNDWEEDMPGRNGAVAADVKLGGGKLGDEWRFRPTRWIQSGTLAERKLSTETLFQPPRGTFLPWSTGPRVCPGQRMAQVEFTAIIFAILSKHRIEAVPHPGESRDALNNRLDRAMQDSISKLALEMNVFNQTDDDDVEVSTSEPGKPFGVDSGLKVRLVTRKA